MRVEAHGERWIIVRGSGPRESFFSFFVDHDKSSWVRRREWNAHRFITKKEANRAVLELRRRAALRRKFRKEHPNAG